MRREAGGINVDNEMMTIMKHRTTNVCLYHTSKSFTVRFHTPA
jgi:hypothetical protein